MWLAAKFCKCARIRKVRAHDHARREKPERTVTRREIENRSLTRLRFLINDAFFSSLLHPCITLRAQWMYNRQKKKNVAQRVDSLCSLWSETRSRRYIFSRARKRIVFFSSHRERTIIHPIPPIVKRENNNTPQKTPRIIGIYLDSKKPILNASRRGILCRTSLVLQSRSLSRACLRGRSNNAWVLYLKSTII